MKNQANIILTKATLRFILFFVLALSISKPLLAQPGDYIDSLITVKTKYTKNEKIDFLVKLQKQSKRKPYNIRFVPTMSCACGNTDFYYEVYSLKDVNKPINRKAFLIHNEKENAEKCLCKSGNAEFYDSKKYSIPSINKNGSYMLIIRGNGFVMYSNIFEVIN